MLWPKKKFPSPDSIPLTLEGFRVRLRPPVLSDYPHWNEVRLRNKDYLTPFEPRWNPKALEKEFFRRKLARQQKDWEQDRGYSFLILNKADDTLIGGVNINHVCRGSAQNASLGYWIDEDLQGQGLMTESLRLIIEYSFSILKLHRLSAATMPHNARSISVLKRLGFVEEGFAKRYIQINGTWEDHVLFGLTAPEE